MPREDDVEADEADDEPRPTRADESRRRRRARRTTTTTDDGRRRVEDGRRRRDADDEVRARRGSSERRGADVRRGVTRGTRVLTAGPAPVVRWRAAGRLSRVAAQAAQHQPGRRLRAERRRLAGHRDALPGQLAHDLLADRVQQDRRAAVAFRLPHGGRGVVDVGDVVGASSGIRQMWSSSVRVQHRRVQACARPPGGRWAPCGRAGPGPGGRRGGRRRRPRAGRRCPAPAASARASRACGQGAVERADAEDARRARPAPRRPAGRAAGGGSRARAGGSAPCPPGARDRSPRGPARSCSARSRRYVAQRWWPSAISAWRRARSVLDRGAARRGR